MDYFTAFEISASGLSVEKLRADLVALNLANANSTSNRADNVFQPLKLLSGSKLNNAVLQDFGAIYNENINLGVDVLSIEKGSLEPRSVYDPKHPLSDENGFVYKPNINTATEMIEMMSALRAYQANIKAISATKVMAEEAIRIGGGR